MLPAGVDIKTPSETNFLIIFFELLLIDKLAAYLLCLNIETSLIAIHFFVFFRVLTCISNGEIFITFALFKFLIIRLLENLFIKKP